MTESAAEGTKRNVEALVPLQSARSRLAEGLTPKNYGKSSGHESHSQIRPKSLYTSRTLRPQKIKSELTTYSLTIRRLHADCLQRARTNTAPENPLDRLVGRLNHVCHIILLAHHNTGVLRDVHRAQAVTLRQVTLRNHTIVDLKLWLRSISHQPKPRPVPLPDIHIASGHGR